jgi:hypothetical protein
MHGLLLKLFGPARHLLLLLRASVRVHRSQLRRSIRRAIGRPLRGLATATGSSSSAIGGRPARGGPHRGLRYQPSDKRAAGGGRRRPTRAGRVDRRATQPAGRPAERRPRRPGGNRAAAGPSQDRCWYRFFMLRVRREGLRCDRAELVRALVAEGVPAEAGYIPVPLYGSPVHRRHGFFARRRRPRRWA